MSYHWVIFGLAVADAVLLVAILADLMARVLLK